MFFVILVYIQPRKIKMGFNTLSREKTSAKGKIVEHKCFVGQHIHGPHNGGGELTQST